VIAAVAIDAVRQERVWSLAEDIEHVLANRDVRDWYVFESASWALAEHRMPPERRRELWHEPLPAVELAARLRHLPLFARVSVDELFRISGAARQGRLEPASVLLQEGAVPESIHLLLDGRVIATARDEAARTIEPPAALGFAEALAGAPSGETVRTTEPGISLALSAAELRILLADNTDLVSGLFATLAGGLEQAAALVQQTGARVELEALADTGLAPIEKVLALQRIPVFSQISAEEMRHLAGIARTVAMERSSTLFEESTPPAIWLLLSGEVSLESSTGAPPLTAAAGDLIGGAHTLAGTAPGRSARVVRSGIALRIDRDDLFSLLEERPELLRQLFAGIFDRRDQASAAAPEAAKV
jgi:CRP-like cAMP-binding protein